MNLWNEYKKIPLPKVLSFIVDNRGKTVPTAKDGNHKLIATNCIRNENLYPSYEKIRLLSEDTYQTWFRAHPIPGDIIFVCKGTPGRTCMVPDPIDFCIAQDMIAFRVDEKQIYNRYLLVVLRSREIQEQIANTSVGDVIPHFKKQFLDQLLIPLPPMDIQKKIGDLYFAMALKEELNKRINENLEQQVQGIFINMFPFIYHPNGNETLGDLVLFSNGKARPKSAGIVPVYGGNGILTYTSVANAVNCVIIGRVGAYCGNVFYCAGKCWVSDNAIQAKSKNNDSQLFIYYLLKNASLQARHIGSGQPLLTQGILNSIPISLPQTNDIEYFISLCHPIAEKIEANKAENLKLSLLRDALLPRLLSGEMDVSDINC